MQKDSNSPLAFQVYVVTTTKGVRQVPQFEHLVDVLADTPTEALLVACQMAAARCDLASGQDHLAPIEAHIVTDSTLSAGF